MASWSSLMRSKDTYLQILRNLIVSFIAVSIDYFLLVFVVSSRASCSSMNCNEFHTKTQAQDQSETLESNSDCGGFHQHKEHDDLQDTDNDETNDFLSQEMYEPEECDSPNGEREKNEEQRDLLSQQMAKPQKNIEITQHTSEDNGQKSEFVGQLMDKYEECDIKLPQHTREANDEKSGFVGQQMAEQELCDTKLREENDEKGEPNASHKKLGKYFFYDSPLSEETGVWIPVSVPPLSESDHEEWARGLYPNGGYFPEGDIGWSQCVEEDKELTMWEVVVEMLLVARGKVSSLASGDIHKVSRISSHLIEQAWKEMADTLTDANISNTTKILEAEPPKWLPDSAASACMLCNIRFHPIICTRHHCRFCGGIFCGECTRGRSLLPSKFHLGILAVCDVCCVRLQSVQSYLMDQVSHAARPWNTIYKATNTIRGYNSKVGSLRPDKAIPDAILRQAKGLAILTIVKVGMMVTYNIGTGLVIARREDGTWSPPSAISSFGVGWGAQAGGELIDLIIILRTNDAIKTFSSDVHLSVGAGLSAAVGIVGRVVEADVRAGDSGYAACYTYSCSKGAFVGYSLEGSIVTTRTRENSRFYGSQSINASNILLGSLPRPAAAAIFYRSLGDLYQKLEK
ncbi:SH3 domain-containing protein PJ696.02 [Camellia lanceoleosa]|uniref:SH3 domain-containing protein PJ696.02 n=1 Tax=Camellia lanceoleosa TaxID=1840588 RepID=A0ACC0GJ00_9ERIC|nr:SH3 domain-containing protein PJ696.02 [Camellia lanceoleosa]